MPFSTYRADRVGRIEALPPGRVTAGEHTTLRLRFTAGDFGIDDTGELKISWRQTSDMGKPQTTAPAGDRFDVEPGRAETYRLVLPIETAAAGNPVPLRTVALDRWATRPTTICRT